jgi:hypothetical protein
MSPKLIFNQYMYERYTHSDAYLHLFEHISTSEDTRPLVLILTELLQDNSSMPGYICSLLKLSPPATYADGAKKLLQQIKAA